MAKKSKGGKKKKAVAGVATVPAPAGAAATPILLSSSAKRFAELVNAYRWQGPDTFPLTNFTFFLGAGFSKSWNLAYPTGPALFQVSPADRNQLTYVERAAISTAPHQPAQLEMADISQIVYSLDMNAKYPAIRARYTDEQNLQQSKNKLRAYFTGRFEQLVDPNWHWYDDALQKFTTPQGYTAGQNQICLLFERMFQLIDGSHGHMEGARFNFITTNYDWLIEQIIDSVCTEDDSAFLYLYRGITPELVCGLPPPVPAFAHSLVFNLLKINGGLEVFREGHGYHFDYRPRTQKDYDNNAPVLMLPSREQDYMDDYFLSIFPKAVRLLHESLALVLVGYSLPEEDALLRFIIRQFCEDEADAIDKHVFYVDLMPAADQLARLRSLFPYAGQDLHVETYSGSFSDWASQVTSLL